LAFSALHSHRGAHDKTAIRLTNNSPSCYPITASLSALKSFKFKAPRSAEANLREVVGNPSNDFGVIQRPTFSSLLRACGSVTKPEAF